MRIGLVTDIHNHHVELSQALRALQRHDVDWIITLGDTCDAFANPAGAIEVVRLLRDCGAVGVWGNHDFALCRNPAERHRARYGVEVLDFLARMEPRLLLADCHFSHEGPSVDPHDIAQLWAVEEGPLNLETVAQRNFAAASERCLFVGHHHRWWLGTPAGRVEWTGEGPVTLAPEERYLIVVAPVCAGWCGVYDTTTRMLVPLRCAEAN